MRPFWHNMASWAETPHGSPMSFLSTAIIMILIMIIITVIMIAMMIKIMPIIAVLITINSPFQPGDFPTGFSTGALCLLLILNLFSVKNASFKSKLSA